MTRPDPSVTPPRVFEPLTTAILGVVLLVRLVLAPSSLANFHPILVTNALSIALLAGAAVAARVPTRREAPDAERNDRWVHWTRWCALVAVLVLLLVEGTLFYPDFIRIQTRPMILLVAGVVAAVIAASGAFRAPRPVAVAAVVCALLASVLLLQPVFENRMLEWVVPTLLSGAVLLMLGLFFRVHALQQAAVESHRQRAELSSKLAMASAELLDSRHRESLSLIASGIAHEVNNPMTYIRGNLDLLREELAGTLHGQSDLGFGAADDLLESMATGLSAITEVVARIRSVFRDSESPPQEVVVYEAARAAIASLPHDGPAVVQVKNLVPRDLIVSAHPADLYIVAANLLRNAVDACRTSNAGRVTVRATRRGGSVEITVADNGVGMTRDQVRRCTDPFYTTRHDRGGMGVGLALCSAIAERTGAELTISSMPGEGSTVRYTIVDQQSYQSTGETR